jgi:hypothetical protein
MQVLTIPLLVILMMAELSSKGSLICSTVSPLVRTMWWRIRRKRDFSLWTSRDGGLVTGIGLGLFILYL